MKILSIKFLNLNSLKGEHEIRFDEAPFSESGLFAITGPTGAGKTTILDAITVALYGQVHRHNRDATEMMSRHTAESYAEVEFEVKEETYRAKWSVRRANGRVEGKIQGVKMELSSVSTGVFLGGHTVTSVQNAIVELCGLDYNQFLRSVILSQGDFTKFLKADDNERSDLLEKITDSGIYSEISSFTFERAKEEKQKLDAIRARLNDVTLLSSAERTALENDLQETVNQEKTVKQQQNLVATQINWKNNLQILNGKIENYKTRIIEQEGLHQQHGPQFKQLIDHDQAVAYKPDLIQIKTINAQGKNLTDDLELLKTSLPVILTGLQVAKQESHAAVTAAKKAQDELASMEPVLDKVIKADATLANLDQQVSRLQKAFDDSKGFLSHQTELKGQKEIQLHQMQEKLKDLQSWLEKNAADAGLEITLTEFRQKVKEMKDISLSLESQRTERSNYLQTVQDDSVFISDNQKRRDELERDFAHTGKLVKDLMTGLEANLAGKNLEELEYEAGVLPSLISTYEKLLQFSLKFQQSKTEKTELDNELKDHHKLYLGTYSDLQKLDQEVLIAGKQLKDLRTLVEIQQRIKNYETDRQVLQPDQPCFLCGSLSHPYLEDNYNHELNAAVLKRDRQEELFATLNLKVQEQKLQVNSLHQQIETREDQVTKLTEGLHVMGNEFAEINSRLPEKLDIADAEAIRKIVSEKQGRQDELNGKIREIRRFHAAVKTALDSQNIKKENLAEIKSQIDIAAERLKFNKAQLVAVTEEISKTEENKSGVEVQINRMLLPYSLIADGELQKIDSVLIQRSSTYQLRVRQVTDLRITETSLRTELEGMDKSITEKQADLSIRENELELETQKLKALKTTRFELFGIKNPSEERERLNNAIQANNKLKEDTQAALQKKQEDLNSNQLQTKQAGESLLAIKNNLHELTGRLVMKLHENGIISIDELYKFFLTDETAQQIRVMQKNIESGINTLKQQLLGTTEEIKKEEAKNLTQQAVEELEAQLGIIEQRISDLNREIGRLNQIIAEDERLKLAHSEIAEQIEVQKIEYERLNKLSALIGSADGKKFSRFAQGLTLARLTGLANRHLLHLSDRYEILKSKEKDLELLIVDKYQADAVRPMATLSGGESFLVSLALALGLSDLASRKVQINSLFIDEGFGTLDADTLDTAISALENLQSTGKTIGVISHVEALKERIGVQIQVSKQQGGHSNIKILSYADGLAGY